MHSFEKIERTAYPPELKPLMAWDGSCGFCGYWVQKWSRLCGPKIDFSPFQEAARDFPDIDLRHFKQASRLIDTDGRVYSGPQSAYKSLQIGGSAWGFLANWYARFSIFTRLSDFIYRFVAGNRNWLFKLSKACFGANPDQPRPFWAIYLFTLFYLVYHYL